MFITEMELLQARLAAGKRLNDSHILKEILQEDRSSERKRRMAEGERYYRGEHDSLQKDFRRSPISETKENGEEELRMFFNPNRSNHHCVHPFHHTLVAQKTAYLVGREPTISVRNGDRAFEEMLTELADEHFNGMLQSWLTGAANKGVEYLHVYYDGEGNFRYCIVPAEEIIAIYDEEYQQELREVIRYYDIKVLDEGREKTKRRVEWWTAEDVTYFTENGDGEFLQEKSCGHWAVTALLDGEETETEQHGWGRVPFIPLRNNEKELTDLQLVKGLIDAYDLVSSEGTNNLLDLVDLYWVIQGYGGETASAVVKKLQINKAVQISDSSGNVEAKQVQLPVEGRLDWMQMLRKDIFHFGMGVDTDSDDWGKAASGVALKFQYAMFYLKINGIVPEIKRAVKEFFRFATEDWNRENGTDWDWRKIQITLNTNGITDDMETMQIIAASKGMVSEKTLLGKHPFVEDVNSEMEQLERERKEKDNEIDTEGMLNGVARAELLQAAEETEQEMADLQEALSGKDGELAENRKTAAVERAILEGGGKNVKAILALLDMEEISYDAKEGLKGLDLEEVKAEAPYLFYEKTEKKKGTGAPMTRQKRKEDEIRAAFRRGLGR